ncbi:DUF2815 family protein [Snodgrassella alvi]|uniref:DUF2815 family protein n=1 Tax=Snodgrassella TaxID=1193515 RepID=UPI000C1DEF5B|nr:DUF2815 family protein [Snodgrassella alvi]PIT41791.1 hypothetical protein BHC53_05390 [Snodgrassella alvi]
MKCILKGVRLSFPNLFQASSVNGSEPRFAANFLIEPDSENAKAVNTAVAQAAKDKWGAKAELELKKLSASDRTCLHDGNLKDYDGYEGNLYLSASNSVKPLVLDKDAKTHLDSSDGRPYAGCYVNAIVDIWVQDNNFGKRINASLRGVQFVKDGDAFSGGGAATEDEFADLAVPDSDADEDFSDLI